MSKGWDAAWLLTTDSRCGHRCGRRVSWYGPGVSEAGNRQFSARVAAEIDRLVISGHEVAAAYRDRPPALASSSAHPALLNAVAAVLLAGPITREDLGRVFPYTPPSIIAALIEANLSAGVLEEGPPGALRLSSPGRSLAEAVVDLQDAAIGEAWAEARAAVDAVRTISADIVRRGLDRQPPAEPAAFVLFAGVWERPTAAAQCLRLITAMRYWRADAHRAGLAHAGLGRREAHVLNHLWDEYRGVERVGQGVPDPGTKGLATLDERGLAAAGRISSAGISLREKVEQDTDSRTDPLYEGMDADERERFLDGLSGLPS